MKRTIFRIIDKTGSSKDKQGNAYGFFLGNEKELCEQYCMDNGFDYQQDEIIVCSPVESEVKE